MERHEQREHLVGTSRLSETIRLSNTHLVQCFDSNGQLKWSEKVPNLVTDEGAIWLLDSGFGTPVGQDWFCGLTQSGAISANDTMNSQNWVEFTGTTHNNRPLLEFSEHEPKTRAETYESEKAQFVVHQAGTISGTFMTTDTVIGGTLGLLYGVTLFPSPQPVVQGDAVYVVIILGSKS